MHKTNIFCLTFALQYFLFSSNLWAQKDSIVNISKSVLENAPIVFLKGDVFYSPSYTFLKNKGNVISLEKEKAISEKTGFVTNFAKNMSIYKDYGLKFVDENCILSLGLRHHIGNKLKNKVFDLAPSINVSYVFRKTLDKNLKEVLQDNTFFTLGLNGRLFLSENIGISFGTGLNLRLYERSGFQLGIVIRK